MPRKKANIRKAPPATDKDPEFLDEDGHSTEISESRQKSRRAVRGKKGGLKAMPNMPMDVLLEIFVYLHPRDLVNLARTNKDFRYCLMNRNTEFIWRAARESVEDLPDRPSYLSEPAYANLAFFTHCHGCLKKNIQTVFWQFRARYCNVCKVSNTQRIGEINFMMPDHLRYGPRFADLVARTMFDRKVWFLKSDVEEVRDAFRALEGNPEEETKYVQQRAAYMREVDKHAFLCDGWMRRRAQNRATELHDAKLSRYEDVLQKLRDLGWEKEVEYFDSRDPRAIQRHPLVWVAKPLTDHAWAKMREEMVEIMEDVRVQRLYAERRILLKKRLSALSPIVDEFYRKMPKNPEVLVNPLPLLVDFAFMPELRELVDAPNATEITEDSLRAVLPKFPALVESWQTNIKAELSKKLAKHIAGHEDGEDLQDLAIAFFRCTSCQLIMRWPEVAAHECMHRFFTPGFADSDTDMAAMYDDTVHAFERKREWSATTLSVPVTKVMEKLLPLLKVFDKPVEFVTAADMDALNGRLCFSTCTKPGCKTFVTWRTAVGPIEMESGPYELATEAERKKVLEVESLAPPAREAYEKKCYWRCSHCPLQRYNNTKMAIRYHLREVHDFRDEDIAEDDIFFSSSDMSQTVWLVSDRLDQQHLSFETRKMLQDGNAHLFTFS